MGVPTASANKPGYHHGNLKQALLDASVLILREKGLEKLTLREAARRAGVSQAAPYRHFDNKEALIAELVKDGFKRIEEKIDVNQSENPTQGPTERLVQMGLAYLSFALESPDYFHLLINMDSVKIQAHKDLNDENNRLIERGLELIRQAQIENGIQGKDEKQLFSLYWALCFGFSTLYISGRSEMLQVDKGELQKLFRNALECLLK